jgi:pyridoxine/pyridoxamine 5'-phosphate oxidase
MGQGALSSIENIETHAQWDLVRGAGARFGAWAPSESNALSAEAHVTAMAGESAAVS